MDIEAIQINSKFKRNSRTLTLVGAIALTIGISLFLSSSALFAPGMLCFSLGVISLVLGVSKILEPEVSLELDEHGLKYHHRRGSIVVQWDNVQRIDIPRGLDGFESIQLPYVGIKLKRINPILDMIPGRLATGLLTEQRPLLMSAVTLDEDLIELEAYMNSEFTPLVVNEERYKGVLAMFGHRCEMLSKNLGFHLYIPADCLDRSADDFVKLLREYRLKNID
ncbi:DUF2982 domain-containing protein [Shewanella eurypsychrophilus]|uniref:DUF2982 domain-containing protein n=1 Tax=Shewanella eurypsychrophilus TaxID=2593656 RepID=A0ABX6V7K5_9GAMM|nr:MULTISPECIES: DUF2982 domain-containing protein [Shewanella]QFU23394.1 DUF2982 domain-containing protein [Shewanella sp. YLB-09]QPG58623.1 DUF2982 domain-containing protein [Shewanella eurypsychrophilus]